VPSAEDTARAKGAVQGEMGNVDFHIAPGVILRISRLAGELIATSPDSPAALDDKGSFTLHIRSARISIDTASLSTLLTRHVFGYSGSPLRNLRVRTEGEELIQTGSLRGWPFRMRAALTLTPEGQIRIHPTAVKVIGVNVRGLMKFFGMSLEGLIKLHPGYGARIEKDDFILDPTGILPPPRIRGRLTAIRLEPGGIAQTFGGNDSSAPLDRPDSAAANYMYFRGGTLRFGKLTMTDTDLEILDDNPADPFDFSLDDYNTQLVAGYNKNTKVHGLIVHMPDFRTLRSGTVNLTPAAKGPAPARKRN
jgi:hypothetical protein